jgi:hypothetical protein
MFVLFQRDEFEELVLTATPTTFNRENIPWSGTIIIRVTKPTKLRRTSMLKRASLGTPRRPAKEFENREDPRQKVLTPNSKATMLGYRSRKKRASPVEIDMSCLPRPCR